MKGSLWDGRLNTYLAVYYVKREGEAVRDPSSGSSSNPQTGASCCYLREGEVTSKGIDVEISGEVLERLQATFGYTYNHIEKNASSLDYTSLTPGTWRSCSPPINCRAPGRPSRWVAG